MVPIPSVTPTEKSVFKLHRQHEVMHLSGQTDTYVIFESYQKLLHVYTVDYTPAL